MNNFGLHFRHKFCEAFKIIHSFKRYSICDDTHSSTLFSNSKHFAKQVFYHCFILFVTCQRIVSTLIYGQIKLFILILHLSCINAFVYKILAWFKGIGVNLHFIKDYLTNVTVCDFAIVVFDCHVFGEFGVA